MARGQKGSIQTIPFFHVEIREGSDSSATSPCLDDLPQPPALDLLWYVVLKVPRRMGLVPAAVGEQEAVLEPDGTHQVQRLLVVLLGLPTEPARLVSLRARKGCPWRERERERGKKKGGPEANIDSPNDHVRGERHVGDAGPDVRHEVQVRLSRVACAGRGAS